MNENPMGIHVLDLTFHYPDGFTALKNIDFSVDSGEHAAVFGPNGAGKSTLMKLLNGLLRPAAGNVLINGKNTRDHLPENLSPEIGIVFQDPDQQIFSSSVRKEVAFGPTNQGRPPSEINHRIRQALHLTDLSECADKHPHDLPYARRKLIALASVLAMEPRIYLLDEPTLGQDHHGRSTILRICRHLKRRQATLIAVTHDVDFAAEAFHRALVMEKGELTADTPMTELIRKMGQGRLHWLPKPRITTLADALNLEPVVSNQTLFIRKIAKSIQQSKTRISHN